MKNRSHAEDDDFDMMGEEDGNLEEYVEEEVTEFEEDDDINDGGDIQDINSGNE